MSLPDVAEKGGSGSRSDPRPNQRFPRTDRLTSRRQYLAVYDSGRRTRGGFLTVFALPNTLGHGRVGLTVTRKMGNAVERNRVKRRLREIFRRNRAHADSLDLVINAYDTIRHATLAQVEDQFLSCLARLVDERGRR